MTEVTYFNRTEIKKPSLYNDPKRLLAYAYRLLAKQDYSEHKLRQKLVLRAENFEIVDETIEALRGQGFLREENYSRLKIKTRLKQGKGKKLIQEELAQEKIAVDEQQFQVAYEELGTTPEAILEAMVEKKLRRVVVEELTFEAKMKLKNKILTFLARNGHSFTTGQRILKKFIS